MMQLMLKASPMMHSRIAPLSLCQPRPQWSAAAASHVIRAAQNERPIGPGRGGKGKKSEPGGHDDATLGQKTGQQTSPMKGPAGRSQPGRGASSGRSSPQRNSYQQDNKASGSSAQLMGRIMACTDLNSLDQVVTADGQHFDYRQVSAAMNKVVKLHRWNQKAMAQRMMQDLSVLAVVELNNMNARTLAGVLWALAKFGGPGNPALVQGIFVRTKEELGSFNAQGISNVLWAMAKLCVPSDDLVHDIMDAATRRLPDFKAQELSNTLWALATMDIPLEGPFLEGWIKYAIQKLPDFKAQELSNTVWALAKMGIPLEGPFLQGWIKYAVQKLPDFKAQELSNTVWGLGTMGIPLEGAFLEGWVKYAIQKLPDFKPQELSNTLWALATVGIPLEGPFLEGWIKYAIQKLPEFKAQNLSNTLWALATIGIPLEGPFLEGWLKYAIQKLPEFKAQELSNTLWGLATMGIPLEGPFLESWVKYAVQKLPDFKPQELSNTLWALATMGIPLEGPVLEDWIKYAIQKLPDFKAQNLSNTLWALVTLGIPLEGPFLEGWVKYAIQKLPDFKAQELSNTLWALATMSIPLEGPFLEGWIKYAVQKLPDFNAQDLSNTLWAAANLGIEDETFNAAWLSVAKQKLPGFNAQELFQTLWAAANLGIKDDEFAATWMTVAKLKLPEFDVQALSNNLSSAAVRGTEAQTVQVVGDASNKALAAYTPNGELRQPINQPFSKGELKAVQEGKWSSTARELAVVKLALEVMEEQRPGYLSGKRFHYGTDCEVALMMMRMVAFPDAPSDSPFLTSCSGAYAKNVATAMGMKGGPGTVPLVKDIRLLCEKLGVELDVVWRRRNHPEQQVADNLSKVEDKEDWSLHQGVYLKLLEHPCLQGRKPTLDVFASGANTKVQGAYYSNYLAVGCLGVDAFQHPWVREGAPREEQLAYIHGPFHLLPQILQRVSEEQVDCIVITPGLSGPWVALLSGLPVQATMKSPRKADLLVAGALVPSRERGRGSKCPKDPLQASIILWGNKQDP